MKNNSKKSLKKYLLVFDLDGTVLNEDHRLEPTVRNTFHSLQEDGFFSTVATGRIFASALPFIKELKIDIPVITCNGAILRDLDNVYYHYRLPKTQAINALEHREEKKMEKYLFYGDKIVTDTKTGFTKSYSDILKVQIERTGSLQEYVEEHEEGPTMIVLIMDKETVPKITRSFEDLNLKDVMITNSNPYFVDVLPKEAGKGKALRRLIKLMDVPKEKVVVFGDGLNDLGMFSEAGISIAVANAESKVKEQADYVTTKDRQAGVMEFIKKHLYNED